MVKDYRISPIPPGGRVTCSCTVNINAAPRSVLYKYRTESPPVFPAAILRHGLTVFFLSGYPNELLRGFRQWGSDTIEIPMYLYAILTHGPLPFVNVG